MGNDLRQAQINSDEASNICKCVHPTVIGISGEQPQDFMTSSSSDHDSDDANLWRPIQQELQRL